MAGKASVRRSRVKSPSSVILFNVRSRMLSCSVLCLSDRSSPMEYELIVERISFRRMGPSESVTRMTGAHLSPKRYFRSYKPRRNPSFPTFMAPPRVR